MPIVNTINSVESFRDEFMVMGRANQFSREAFEALFDYYDQMEEQVELDVIAICCEWTEYEDIEDVEEAYSLESFEDMDHFYLLTGTSVLVSE